MRLRERQRAFFARLTEPAEPEPVAGMTVYQAAYPARLAEALEDNFPVLSRLLGEDALQALALEYARAHSSRHYSLRWFGHRLSDHLARHPRPGLPDGADLAAFEWALRGAFDAADAEPLALAALARVPAGDWGALPLRPHPSLRTLATRWQVVARWRALEAGRADPGARAGGGRIAVWRDGLVVRFRSLDEEEGEALTEFMASPSFAAWCEALAARHPRPVETAGALLGEWLAAGWVVLEG